MAALCAWQGNIPGPPPSTANTMLQAPFNLSHPTLRNFPFFRRPRNPRVFALAFGLSLSIVDVFLNCWASAPFLFHLASAPCCHAFFSCHSANHCLGTPERSEHYHWISAASHSPSYWHYMRFMPTLGAEMPLALVFYPATLALLQHIIYDVYYLQMVVCSLSASRHVAYGTHASSWPFLK
ncbi:hypothetical protein BS50DRAFT_23742 [Corynespora cassiicola Philippines]|uniref:Uncharacterized protein n=1 Tax=Corynespora cassiicola Philippines TaxID=1448308 RepID=A0A2T2PAU9_CORCC|nr:hypothetical protein BS50DRAFT_23742 [Corynespora cassiicola Philippines]